MSRLATGPGAPIELSEAQFRQVGALMSRVAGIQLPPGKEGLVRTRLTPRLRALGLASVGEYLSLVERDGTRAELSEMVEVLTTNKTAFFREPEHFDALASAVLPVFARRGDPVRIWSAGCSSGEEPYSIAMVARDVLGAAAPVRILATDISSRMLARARAAVYAAAALRDVPPARRRAHFEPLDASDGSMRVVAGTRTLVQVARLNLMGGWPMRGPFEVVFCRNVMIYFDKATQQRLVRRFAALLAPGGFLFVGHSESLSGLQHDLAYVQPATYRRD